MTLNSKGQFVVQDMVSYSHCMRAVVGYRPIFGSFQKNISYITSLSVYIYIYIKYPLVGTVSVSEMTLPYFRLVNYNYLAIYLHHFLPVYFNAQSTKPNQYDLNHSNSILSHDSA